MGAVDTLDSIIADPLDLVVPTSPLPENLTDQRQWAEVRKLQIDTERAAAELVKTTNFVEFPSAANGSSTKLVR